MAQGSALFYFRDELLSVCKGVVPVEGARVRRHHPVQRSAGSAELRYCLVLDLAPGWADTCKHVQYELSWPTADEQVSELAVPPKQPTTTKQGRAAGLPPERLPCEALTLGLQAKWAKALLLASVPRAALLRQAAASERCSLRCAMAERGVADAAAEPLLLSTTVPRAACPACSRLLRAALCSTPAQLPARRLRLPPRWPWTWTRCVPPARPP